MPNEFRSTTIEALLRDVTGEERHYSNVNSLFTFIEGEYAFWNEKVPKVPQNNQLNQVHQYVNTSFSAFTSLEQSFPSWDEPTRATQLQQAIANISSHFNQFIIFSDTPFTEKFLEICEINAQQASFFWQYTVRPLAENPGLPDIASFQGAVLAYEFKYQGESTITKRREAEKKAIATLRRSLADKTDETIRTADEFQEKMLTDSKEFKSELNEWKTATETNLAAKQEEDRSLRETFIEDGNKRLQDLEKLYNEKLKLEKPAEYWNKQAEKHKKSGKKWTQCLVLSTALSAIVFISLFCQWLSSGKQVEKLSSLHWQGVILLGAVLSLSIFTIKTFSRLTFSSFHLQQDAEEREQLAYFYLALCHETEIDTDARKIVFQSLFSRAESGLLTAEHGPTMPMVDMVKQMKPGQQG